MKIPSDIRPKDVIRTLEKFGFKKHKSKGSHIYFRHSDGRWTQIAIHPKPIPGGTLRKILNQAEIAPEDFVKQL